MENVKETYNKSESTTNANAESHYKLIGTGVFIGLIGIFLRFLTDWSFAGIISNVIFIIGIVLCLKAVLNILK